MHHAGHDEEDTIEKGARHVFDFAAPHRAHADHCDPVARGAPGHAHPAGCFHLEFHGFFC